MHTKLSLLPLLAALAALAAPMTAQAVNSVMADNFPLTSNPEVGSPWSFGYYTSDSESSFKLFSDQSDLSSWTNNHDWFDSTHVISFAPTVIRNASGDTAHGVPNGAVALHPGPGVGVTLVLDSAAAIFTATTTGYYEWNASFGAGDSGSVDVEVGVYRPATTIFERGLLQTGQTTADVSGSGQVWLAGGDRIVFRVGNNGLFSYDTTPLWAEVSSVLTPSNVRAAQRAGTKLVDIDYDLTGTATPVFVALEISADGGTTWAVPATTLTGAVGTNVTPGTNLRITWNAGADWPNQTSAQTRFRLRVGDRWPDLANFAAIPGGSFSMGDTLDGNPEGNAPTHTVNVSAFLMQRKEVTKTEWDAVRGWGMSQGYTDLNGGAGNGAEHPVQSITWYDRVKWCNAKSARDGLTPCYYTDAAQTNVYRTGTFDISNTMVKWTANGYRLPTEAEWEKAARGGLDGKRYPSGDTLNPTEANYNNPSYTVEVGSYAPNGYGLYDMAGNVWEWLWDWYDGSYYSALPATDPHGPASGSVRVLRGGSWGDPAIICRVGRRNLSSPGDFDNGVGFRPVRANFAISDSPNIPVNTKDQILTIIALHGTTDPVAGQYQYSLNGTAQLTALTPDLGYLFNKWTGDATGSANPLSVTMDSSKTITAVFAPDSRDPDGDGLTNYEEIITYQTDPNVADTDGDSFSDGYEVHHGTLPKDPASRPDATLQIFTAVEVRLDSALGQSYRIESSTDLQTWTPVEEHIAGTGGTVTRFYSIQEIPQRYFKPVRE